MRRQGHHNSLNSPIDSGPCSGKRQTLRVVTARDLITSSVVLLRPPYNIVREWRQTGPPALRPYPRRRGTEIYTDTTASHCYRICQTTNFFWHYPLYRCQFLFFRSVPYITFQNVCTCDINLVCPAVHCSGTWSGSFERFLQKKCNF